MARLRGNDARRLPGHPRVKVLLNGLQAGNRSGTGRYTIALAQWLPEVADDIELTVAWPTDVAPPETQAVLVPVNVGGGLSRILIDQRHMIAIARDMGADFIHYPANIGLMFSNYPSILTVHDLSFFVNPDWFRKERARYYQLGVRRSAKRARVVISDSESTSNDLRKFLALPDSKIATVPLGVARNLERPDDNAIETARKKYNLPEKFALYKGTIEPRKNIERLIDAFNIVANEWEGDLVIAGRRGWHDEGIIEKAKSDRIHLAGFIDDVDQAAVYAAAHAFVWPSLYEGFGLPPLEAMAYGTPVMTSNTSSLPEAVGDAAATVDPEKHDSIVQGLRTILLDENERDTLRERGHKRVKELTWYRTALGVAEAYRKAAAL